MKKILVPIDSIEWDNTLRGIESSIDLASTHESSETPQIILMHVLHSVTGISEEYRKEERKMEKDRITREFKTIKEWCKEKGIDNVKTIIKDRKPQEKLGIDGHIIETARKEDVDLIVMGSGKLQDRSVKGKVEKYIYGSVTENVLHEAPCSIFIARPPS
ncbi:MAG: universal stress protein [Candidatus Hadarchaeia archaeon]